MVTVADIVANAVLDQAYDWLCKRRREYPADADVWSFRRNWQQEKATLKTELLEGNYRVNLLSRVTLKTQEDIDLFSARDALVLKALSLVLAEHLPISRRCTHIKENGGSKGAIGQVLKNLPRNRFVLKTDVRSYYASIEHERLLDRLSVVIKDRRVLKLVVQYLNRTAERGGLYWEYTKGIALGCPLSPIIGAFFLNELDKCMERLRLFYVRFMDDIVVLAPTRRWLRKAVRAVNQVLASLGLEKHPGKTFIGQTKKGFDFLGYHFHPGGLTIAKETLVRFVERAARLYEQEGRDSNATSPLGLYVRRWVRWSQAGVAAQH